MSLFHQGMTAIEPYVTAYGVPALLIIIYFEALGAPLPGESALVASGVLAAHGELAIAHLVPAIWAGAVLGDSTGYLIGRLGGRALLVRFGPYVKLTASRLAELEAKFQKYGFVIVLFARFMVPLRQLNGLVAGSLRMPWTRFFAANALGAALWVTVWGLGPYFFTELFHADH